MDSRTPDAENHTDLSGTVAVVTGASSGIGEATARALAAEGVTVGLAARSEDRLTDLARDIDRAGGEALVLPTDIRDRTAVDAMVDRTVDAFGRLDVVVNSAGVGHWDREGVVDGDFEEWRAEIEVNLLGVMAGTQAAARIFQEQGTGHVVNVSSGSGRFPSLEHPAYTASKHGVNGFTESARRDLASEGIRVTLVEPGRVATPMQPAADRETTAMLAPEDVAAIIVHAVSLPPGVCLADAFIVPTGH